MAICAVNKIDSNSTGLRFAFEECIGELPQYESAVAASGSITVAALPEADEGVQVGSLSLTFVDSSPGAGEVLIGGSVASTAQNLATALSANSNISVQVAAGSAVVNIRAAEAGTAGNAIALTTTADGLTLSGATLSGGSNAIGDPFTWDPLEPNSYGDFGGTTETVSRAVIAEDRQRKKGVVVSVAASGAFNQDLTQKNAQKLLTAFLFADIREKQSYQVNGTAGQISVVKAADSFAEIHASGFSWTSFNIIPGEWIFVGGDASATRFDEEANNGFKRVRAVTASILTIDKSDLPMEAATGAGKTISVFLGRVLKNEAQRNLIKRKTVQLERTLGSLDGLDPPQSEYLVGAVASELSINVSVEEKLTVDYTFVAIDHETRTQAEGLKPGDRPQVEEADAFNASNDVQRMRLSLAGENVEAPDSLFGFATEFTGTVNNTLTPSSAIGRTTAFDVTAGTFAVDGSIEAYFSDIRAIAAVRDNYDMTFDLIMVKENAGIVMDMPLVSLGNGQANVALDQPIMLPLSTGAATGAKIDPNLNHTLLFTFFDVLPNLAE